MFCYEFPIVYCTYSYNCVCVLDFFASLATGGYLANEKGKIEIKTCGLPRLCRFIHFQDFHVGPQVLQFMHENVITHIKEFKVTENMEFAYSFAATSCMSHIYDDLMQV